jgi:signal transduction histidine kinase
VKRSRLPWVILAFAGVFFVATIAVTIGNGNFDDPFIFFAIAMVLGYSVVGAVVASRRPDNAVGWLMMAVGISFLLVGLSDEYVRYVYVTDPGSLPLGSAAAWVGNWIFNAETASILLMAVLYPTGRAPSRGWRFLPRAIVIITGAFTLAAILRPGPLDVAASARIQNPTGIPALRALNGELVSAIGSVLLIVVALASVAATVHRYRRARGEERQQVRLFAYAALTAAVILALSTAVGAGLGGETVLSDVLFFAFFSVVGIGIPVAVGVAMLRYRLLEVDVVIRKTVVFAILAAILTLVFMVLAAALGTVLGIVARGSPPSLLVAAFVLGLLTVPLWRVSSRIADRLVFGGRKTPYEVLSEFSHGVSETYSTDDVLPRMAGVVAEATGATRAVVWMRLGDELRPVGTWPRDRVPKPVPGAEASVFVEGEDTFEIRHQGEVLGALSVDMPPSDPMNDSKAKLIEDLARQAGPLVRNVRLIEELRASRQRLVAAQDQERRRLERDIHDGAQQQLVALAVKLRLVEAMAGRDPAKAGELAAEARAETQQALEDLRDLARGIYPPLLADQGLAAAVEGQARKSPLPVEVQPDGLGRYPQEAEAAAYFCVLEALQNAAKYAGASRVLVRLWADDGELRFAVHDDGLGFDPAATPRGTGLQNMTDRVEALGGSLQIDSLPRSGTTVTGRIPV